MSKIRNDHVFSYRFLTWESLPISDRKNLPIWARTCEEATLTLWDWREWLRRRTHSSIYFAAITASIKVKSINLLKVSLSTPIIITYFAKMADRNLQVSHSLLLHSSLLDQRHSANLTSPLAASTSLNRAYIALTLITLSSIQWRLISLL